MITMKRNIKRTISTLLILVSLGVLPPLHVAQAAGAAGSSSVADLIHAAVKTFVDLMYELNPFLPSTIKDNGLLLETNENADKTTEAINANSINYSLTDFVGFRELGTPAKPGNKSDTEKYLKFLKDKQARDILSTEKTFDAKRPTIKDSFSLYQETMSVLSAGYQKKQFKEFLKSKDKRAAAAFGRSNIPDPVTLAMGVDHSIKPSDKLKRTFDEFMKAKKLCAPFPPDKDGGYPKCKLDQEREELFKQKFMYEIFFGDKNQRAEHDPNSTYYNIASLMNPLAYTEEQEKAASYMLKNIEKSIKLPPIQPPQIPQPMTPKQFENLVKQLTDPDAKYNPFDKIKTLQSEYTDITKSLLINRSILMNNFYRIYAQRKEDPTVVDSGLTDTKGQPLRSSRQLRAYLANRRLDKRWYKAMSEASPATIQRETLFVLAEMRQQMFENRKDIEHILLTLSVMALGQMKEQGTDITRLNGMIRREIHNLLSKGGSQNRKLDQASEPGGDTEGAATGLTDSISADSQPPEMPGDDNKK